MLPFQLGFLFNSLEVGLEVNWLNELGKVSVSQSYVWIGTNSPEEGSHTFWGRIEAFHIRISFGNLLHETCQLLHI